MAKNLKEALEENHRAAVELDRALRDCLSDLTDTDQPATEGRFRVVQGGRAARIR